MEEVTAATGDISPTILSQTQSSSQSFLNHTYLVNAYRVPGIVWDSDGNITMVSKGSLFQEAHSLVHKTQ